MRNSRRQSRPRRVRFVISGLGFVFSAPELLIVQGSSFRKFGGGGASALAGAALRFQEQDAHIRLSELHGIFICGGERLPVMAVRFVIRCRRAPRLVPTLGSCNWKST